MLCFYDAMAHLNKLNLVTSFLQTGFLRGFKWANYEWCHGQDSKKLSTTWRKMSLKANERHRRGRNVCVEGGGGRGGGFKDVCRLMHFLRRFIKRLLGFPLFLLHKLRRKNTNCYWSDTSWNDAALQRNKNEKTTHRGRDVVEKNGRITKKNAGWAAADTERTRTRECGWAEKSRVAAARWGGP